MNTFPFEAVSDREPFRLCRSGLLTVGAATYNVDIQMFRDGAKVTWLVGPGRALYFLRPCAGAGEFARQVISWASGQPLCVDGKEVRLRTIGESITVVH